MHTHEIKEMELELESYLSAMLGSLGGKQRVAALFQYVSGLLLDGKRKSIEPIAQRLASREEDVQAIRQRMQRAVSEASWDEREVYARIGERVDERMPGLKAYALDDTGIEKWGDHTVGVKRQYSGTLGKIGNCQVVTTLHVVGDESSCCLGGRLYLPEEWVDDAKRRKKGRIPPEVAYQTKPEIGLSLIDEALNQGRPNRLVLADCGYGRSHAFREGLTDRGLRYSVGVDGKQRVWPERSRLFVPCRTGKKGRPRSRHESLDGDQPMRLDTLANQVEAQQRFRRVTYRDGAGGKRRGYFWRGRVRSAEGHEKGKEPGYGEWILIECIKPGEYKYYFSTLQKTTSLRTLVRLTKLRFRVEQDYREMKGELGLDHFEGRTWNGFHHHLAMCAVAYAFLALKRALFFPSTKQLNSCVSLDRSTVTQTPATHFAGLVAPLSVVQATG
jgi:SRSO17 transposase